jgi:hypothetical protein
MSPDYAQTPPTLAGGVCEGGHSPVKSCAFNIGRATEKCEQKCQGESGSSE